MMKGGLNEYHLHYEDLSSVPKPSIKTRVRGAKNITKSILGISSHTRFNGFIPLAFQSLKGVDKRRILAYGKNHLIDRTPMPSLPQTDKAVPKKKGKG